MVREQNRRRGRIFRFSQGALLLADGIHLLRRERSLWPLALVPMLLALGAVAGAGSFFVSQLSEIHSVWSGLVPTFEVSEWWSWLWVGPARGFFWLASWLAVVASFAVSMVAALLLAKLLSSPFLDQLSQRVETIERGGADEPESGSSWLGEIISSFMAELARVGFLGFIWLGLSLGGLLIPGAQLVSGPLLVIVTILFLPLDYAGFALDRRGVPFLRRRAWLQEHFATMVGFGAVAFFVTLVPGLNLLMLPCLVTAGTLLVLRISPDSEVGPGPREVPFG